MGVCKFDLLLVILICYMTLSVNESLCYRFINDIYMDLFEPRLGQMSDSSYFSIMVDAATDTSVRDLCGVYCRFLVDGKPVNMFLAVEELRHCHADGYIAAIERGN